MKSEINRSCAGWGVVAGKKKRGKALGAESVNGGLPWDCLQHSSASGLEAKRLETGASSRACRAVRRHTIVRIPEVPDFFSVRAQVGLVTNLRISISQAAGGGEAPAEERFPDEVSELHGFRHNAWTARGSAPCVSLSMFVPFLSRTLFSAIRIESTRSVCCNCCFWAQLICEGYG